MNDEIINTELDSDLQDRLDAIASDLQESWMEDPPTRRETIRYLAQVYHGEIDE